MSVLTHAFVKMKLLYLQTFSSKSRENTLKHTKKIQINNEELIYSILDIEITCSKKKKTQMNTRIQ